MDLEAKSMKELLGLHNTVADAPAGPKTFSTKTKLIARICAIVEAKEINLAALATPSAPTDAAVASPPQAMQALVEDRRARKRGLGIGELARVLIMDPVGYPHALIAAMVNAQIEGALATAKSVRWYASKMRKEGTDVPARTKHFGPNLDEEQSKEYLKTVTVVGGVQLTVEPSQAS